MQDDLLCALRTAVLAGDALSSSSLRRMQNDYATPFPPYRCSQCHARLFNGWLFGEIKCWRCAQMFEGSLVHFLNALAKIPGP